MPRPAHLLVALLFLTPASSFSRGRPVKSPDMPLAIGEEVGLVFAMALAYRRMGLGASRS